MVWRCPLPLVCAVVRGIAPLRYVPIFRRIVARRRTIEHLDLPDERERVEHVLTAFGRLRTGKLALPRIRPKRAEAPAANLSPAERMKALRSGGVAKPQSRAAGERLRGDADAVAGRIVEFLAENGFLK
jgi:hypothetical protein